MNKYYKELHESVEETLHKAQKKPAVIYLEAGHFNPSFGSDDFSENSLNDAIEFGGELIKKHGKSIRIVFGVLIDDLGLQCGKDVCEISTVSEIQSDKITEELEAILASSKLVKRERLLVFSERTTKNRAINRLKKLISKQSDLIRVKGEQETEKCQVMMPLNHEGDEILLSNKEAHVYGIKCPGIMGQHYDDVLLKLRERFFQASSFHIIDWSEIMDETKVSHGARAFSNVFNTHRSSDFQQIHISNVFFADDEGELTKTNHEKAIVSTVLEAEDIAV